MAWFFLSLSCPPLAPHTSWHVQCWCLACEKPASHCEEWSVHCHFTATAQRPGGALCLRQPLQGDAQDPGSAAAAAAAVQGPSYKHCTSPHSTLRTHHSARGTCTRFGGALRLPRGTQSAAQAAHSSGPVPAPCDFMSSTAPMPADRRNSGEEGAAIHMDGPVMHAHTGGEGPEHVASSMQLPEGTDELVHDDVGPRGTSQVLHHF